MRILNFTFKNEAMWMLLFTIALILLGVIGIIVVRVLTGIQ